MLQDRAAGCTWLLSVLCASRDNQRWPSMLADIQEGFLQLLGDANPVTQVRNGVLMGVNFGFHAFIGTMVANTCRFAYCRVPDAL